MGSVDTGIAEAECYQQAQTWGWQRPPKEVIDIVRQAQDAQSTKSAQLLVDMGVVTEQQMQSLLARKPQNIQTIAWFAQQKASVVPFVPYVERVLALKAGYPYYANLALLSIHSCMHEVAVTHRADELDAAVMLIEETTPVVVFSSFTTLIKFRSLGRADRLRDPILKYVGNNVHLAVGARDEISAVLKKIRSDEHSAGLGDSANLWNAASAENLSKPENREITRLIDHALTQGGTDIALMPLRSGDMQVCIRKFGELIPPKATTTRLNAELARQVVALLQMKSGANPTNTTQRVPTDGQITYRSGSGDAFLRLSFIPMNHLGELRNLTSVSIRLLPRAESSISLYDLKLEQSVIEQIQFAMRISQGLVLVVGPTNSGKSTTVAGAIGEHVKLFGATRKRLSAEDPIERFLNGVQQYNAPVHIQDEAQRFEIMLKAFKRHDPDMIWVGEVRDKVTADLCVSSASTGHIVLSTLHANDAVMAFDVLAKTVDADKRFQLIESMALVISQRLVKEICPHCSTVGAPTQADRELFAQYTAMIGERADLPDRIAHANVQGCAHCHEGYVGLLPINEALPFSRDAKDAAIAMLGGANRRETLAKSRTLTLLQSGLNLLAQHKVDLDAILV